MIAPPEPLAPAQLRELAAAPAAARDFSALTGRPFLLYTACGDGLGAADTARVCDWLRQLPCPTICVGGPRAPRALVRSADVIVPTAQEAAAVVAAVRNRPLASAVLVQLLRATEKLPVADALLAESFAYATLQAGPEHRAWLAQNQARPAPRRDEGPAVVVTRDGRTLSVELNRPSNRNALSVEVRDALVEALELAIADDTVRAVRVSGRGKCFSVGGDLAEFGQVPDPATGHAIRSVVLPARAFARCAERLHCRVHSACIGAGAELPAFASRLVAAPNTFFQLPELDMGLLPGAGGTVSLPRRIGRQRTAWLVLTGRRLGARLALEWGLVDAIEAPAAAGHGGRGQRS